MSCHVMSISSCFEVIKLLQIPLEVSPSFIIYQLYLSSFICFQNILFHPLAMDWRPNTQYENVSIIYGTAQSAKNREFTGV